jgi:hypothetical protein
VLQTERLGTAGVSAPSVREIEGAGTEVVAYGGGEGVGFGQPRLVVSVLQEIPCAPQAASRSGHQGLNFLQAQIDAWEQTIPAPAVNLVYILKQYLPCGRIRW